MEVPRDDLAEQTVIGCCIDRHVTYRRISELLAPEHLYRPDLRRVLECCSRLGHLDGPSLDVLERRIAAVAAECRMRPEDVRALVEERPVMADVSRSYTNRVLKAAKARRLMSAAAEMYNQLGSGQPIDVALEQAVQAARSIAGAAA